MDPSTLVDKPGVAKKPLVKKRVKKGTGEGSNKKPKVPPPPKETSDVTTVNKDSVEPRVSTKPDSVPVEMTSEEELDPDVRVCLRTSQTSQWKTLVDILKDLIVESPIHFDETGMKLVSMDPAQVALISVHAKSEFYVCREPVRIGISMISLHRLLRNLTPSGYIMELSLLYSEPQFMRLRLTNPDKRSVSFNKIHLLRLDIEEITIPSTVFDRVLSLPSTDFQRHIRELSAVSDRIGIRSTKDTLYLSAEGTMGFSEIEIKPSTSGLNWHLINTDQGDNGNEVTGIFLAKYLERFSKPLDVTAELFLKKDFPMVLRYKLPSVTVRFLLAPALEEDTV